MPKFTQRTMTFSRAQCEYSTLKLVVSGGHTSRPKASQKPLSCTVQSQSTSYFAIGKRLWRQSANYSSTSKY